MKKLPFILVFLAFMLFSCSKNTSISNAPEVDSLIESVSPTGIGRMTPIRISFAKEPKGNLLNAISLSPKQNGDWEVSEDNRTAIFTPEKPYKSGEEIILSADCKKLFEVDVENSIYKHRLLISTPKYSVNFDEIRFDEQKSLYTISGNVETDIAVSVEEISSVLNAKICDNKNKKEDVQIEWTKSDVNEKWLFSLQNIESGLTKKSVELSWNGKKLGLSKKNDIFSGNKKIDIPSKSDFEVLDINTSKENVILVSFSKNLDTTQEIESFLRMRDFEGKFGKNNFNASIRGNVLSIFSDSNFGGIQTVSLEKGIKSTDGIPLETAPSVTLSDNWDTPQVRFLTSNVILPTTQGSVFPIETKNLSGLLIQVYAIYNRNIYHFFQDNELNDSGYIYKVGEPVWEKKVNFDWNDSMQNRFVPRGLEMSELLKKYPSGMFHIRISFRKDQIKYVCHRNHKSFDSIPMPPDTIEEYSTPVEKSSWDYWENVDRKDRDSYWSYNNDPCHPAFYMPRYNSSSVISKNVLISDLGIMAKRDKSNKLFVSIADIKTAQPVSGANVELLSYVGGKIASAKTDSKGCVVFNDSSKVFIISATLNGQTSFLKIGTGNSLSTSHFEIGGEIAENGVKGAIYAERGVWRPGDAIYLTFVLQDLENTLPKSIPVTFELTDPMGRLVETKLLSENLNGFYPIQTKTNADSPTGTWTASIKIGGKTWTKRLSVETVVPNKLSVELNAETEILKKEKNNFTLKGAWLHGAETPNYKADVSVSFSEMATTFDGYSEFTFTNPNNKLDSSKETIWSGKLDANSQAKFSKSLDAGSKLPGKLRANFLSRVFEPAGGFSTQSKSFVYSPYEKYVGLKLPKGDAARNMLLTDVDHTVDVVCLSPEGKPSSSNSVSYKIYKLNWKWWWEKDAYTDATYVSSYYRETIASGSVAISNGKGSFKFQVKYPSWGRYLVEISDGSYGHSAAKIVYIDWPGWAGRAQESGSGSSSMVPLVTSKKQYSVGETAEVSFASSKGGKALVSIEKAGVLINQFWVDTVDGTTVCKLLLTQQMSPNVYAHVTLLQPHLQTANSLPIRLYGVVPIMVDDPQTNLNPVIQSAEKFEPNKEATFSVSEASGREMTYTLAVVDEGLLGLTNHHGQNLRSEFYKKEASQLENWDIYRYVTNAYSGKLETKLAIGGGGDYYNDDRERGGNRFEPVVKFFGPYHLKAGEKKATKFMMPYYVGAVRAIVIAGYKGAYGVAEKSVQVKSELMVQPSLPRSLGSNESLKIPVTVFNGDNFAKNVTVTFSMRGIMNRSISKDTKIEANGNSTVLFDINTQRPGPLTIEVSAKSGDKVVKSIKSIEIKSRGMKTSQKMIFATNPSKQSKVIVPSNYENGTTELSLELSTMPQIDLNSRLNYLTEYPHGCIEQITSGGFPQIFVPSYIELNPSEINRIKKNVMSVIERYKTYQTSAGGMGYWPGNTEPHSWGSAYASHFMLEAKKNGYDVPDSILNPCLKWLSDSAASWTSYSDYDTATQCYKLYVLALAGKADLGAMNRLSPNSLNGESKLLLAAAYAQSGRKKLASDLLKDFAYSTNGRSTGGNFSSDIREVAIYMIAQNLCGNISELVKTSKSISDTLSSTKWLSTQECAWSLCALLPYYTEQSNGSASFEYSVNNSETKNKGSFNTSSIIEKLNASKTAKTQFVDLTNTGSKALYGTLTSSGTTIAGTEQEINNKISMEVSGFEKIDSLKVGDTFKIEVKIKNNTNIDLKNLALTLPRPTCIEFTNERVQDSSNDYYSSTKTNYTYRDIRDDAIYTYFDLDDYRTAKYEFNATISHTGDYYIPAIHVEAMYDDDIKAVKPGRFVRMGNIIDKDEK